MRRFLEWLAVVAFGAGLGLLAAWAERHWGIPPALVQGTFLVVGIAALAYGLWAWIGFLRAMAEEDEWPDD